MTHEGINLGDSVNEPTEVDGSYLRIRDCARGRGLGSPARKVSASDSRVRLFVIILWVISLGFLSYSFKIVRPTAVE